MRLRRLVALGLFVAFSSLAVAQTEKDKKWKKVSLDNDITFSMPEEPKAMEKDQMGIKLKMWAYETPNQGGVYMVATNKLPAAPNADLAKDVLEGAAKGQFQGMGGTLKKSTEIKLGKNPGLESEGTVPFGANGTAKSRIFVVGDSMYQVLVLGDKDFVNSADSKKFLESFKQKEKQ